MFCWGLYWTPDLSAGSYRIAPVVGWLFGYLVGWLVNHQDNSITTLRIYPIFCRMIQNDKISKLAEGIF